MNPSVNIYTKWGVLSLLLLLSSSGALLGQTVQGMDNERLAKIDGLIENHIKEQHIPGAVALIIRDGKTVFNKAYGHADLAKGIPMKTDHIFRIASQSKAITSLAVMMLWEEGKFLLDDPVSRYIPAFKETGVLATFNPADSSFTTVPAQRQITIRDLLRHTSGIAYPAIFSDSTMWAIYQKNHIPSGIGTMNGTLADKMPSLAKMPLQHQPGEAFTYGLNTDLLGYLVELWSGRPFDVFLRERIFDPLDMEDTFFHVPTEKHHRVVTLYESNGDRLEKVDHPIYEGVDPDFPIKEGTYLSGGAGLSTTVSDYANFLSMFLNKGTYKNKRILGSKTVELMLTNQLTLDMAISPYPAQPDDFQFGLGFALETEKNDYLSPFSIGTFSWGGAFNTHYWADPKEKLIGLLFTQEYLSPYWRIGDEFEVLVYQGIME